MEGAFAPWTTFWEHFSFVFLAALVCFSITFYFKNLFCKLTSFQLGLQVLSSSKKKKKKVHLEQLSSPHNSLIKLWRKCL